MLKTTTRDKEDHVQEVLDALKREHEFIVMQYRIWNKMIAGGMHGSTSEPPTTSMFVRAGDTNSKKTSAVPMTPTSGIRATGYSTARVIDNRSKCYNQLGELRNLKVSGLLSDPEYATEHASIMSTLKNPTP